EVESLETHLEPAAAAERQVLEERRVERSIARPRHGVAAQVAYRSGGRQQEATRVEPLVRIAEQRIRRTPRRGIRPLAGDAGPWQRTRAIEAEHGRDRDAAVRREDARDLPAGREPVRETRQVIAEGHLPRRVRTEVVADVEIRQPLVQRWNRAVRRLKAVGEIT